MVVIKTGAAEHIVYISMPPKGLWGFMRACASHSARPAVLRVHGSNAEKLWYDAEVSFFLPVCFTEHSTVAEESPQFWRLHC